MKAITQDRYGTAAVLRVTEVERPAPGPGQVLVRVLAAGMDRGAWHFMTGEPYLMRLLGFGFRAPSIPTPGTNFAGIVEAVGPGVDSYRPGDEVYGASRATFAEYAVASVEKLAPKPAQFTFEQAAVMPYPAFVALHALRELGRLEPGERVLVVGASGAVGTIAVQLAAAFGGAVTGVCSARHADLVRSLGADDVIDYRAQGLGDDPRTFDLVVDIGGRTSIAQLRRVLTPTGRLVIVGGEGDRWIGGIQRQLWATLLSPFVSQELTAFVVREHTDALLALNELVAQGSVVPTLGATFPLERGVEAVAAFEAGAVDGRIVIAP